MPEHVSREVLSALCDGECAPDERRRAHEHLSTCADCRGTLDGLSGVKELVADLPPLVAPAPFVADVLSRRTAADRLRGAFRGPRRWAAAAAVTVAVGVTLAGLAVPPERSEPPVEVFVTRHVSVNTQDHVGGQVLFAVSGR